MDQDILGGIVVIVGILLVFAITALDRLKEKQAGTGCLEAGSFCKCPFSHYEARTSS